MSRSRPNAQRTPLGRAARMGLGYVLIFGLAMLALWGGSRLLHHPRGRAAVPSPATMVSGQAPTTLVSGDYRLSVEAARWIRQDALPKDLRLSYRSRPSPLVDYLVLAVAVADLGAGPLPLRYADSGQNVRFVVTSNDPDTFFVEPVPASDAAAIAGTPALPNGSLAAGATRTGVLVFAIEPYRKNLELLLVPSYPTGSGPAQGPAYPGIRVRLPAQR